MLTGFYFQHLFFLGKRIFKLTKPSTMNRLVLLLLLIASTITVNAQEVLPIDESTKANSKGTYPAYQIEIPGGSLKDISKNWQKYISTGSKAKVELLNGELILNGAVNSNISPNPFLIISKLMDIPGSVRLTVWLAEDESSYISKELGNDRHLTALKFVRDFGIQEYRAIVNTLLKSEENKLKSLEKERENLIKEEERAAKKISENQRSIQRSNDAIATVNGDIQNTSYKISEQKYMVEKTVSDKNANKGAKQTLKSLENEKKRLQSKNEAEAKSIDKMNKEIRQAERTIAQSKEQQAGKTAEIETQKQKVKEVQLKLETIR